MSRGGESTAHTAADPGRGRAGRRVAAVHSGGMTVARSELLVPGPAVALGALLDEDVSAIGDGWELPPLWHWVYLLDRPAQADLGPEGHSRHAVPAPPREGLRRMFAGGRVRIHRPLRLGAPATRSVEVVDTSTRHGRSGVFTVVTTRATLTQDGGPAVVDEQDIVYREPTPLPTAARPDGAPPQDWPWRSLRIDPVLLFRFSALTYNAHRIHYDVDYCREADYPGLVVHGPLQALLMAEAVRGRGAVRALSYRLVAPLTLGQGIQVGASPVSTPVRAEVRDAAGRRTATAEFDVG